MARIVVVFDFDKTIIDVDSDNWVVDELGATEIFNSLLPTMPWNPLMDKMMMELHAQGKTTQDIENALKRAHMHHRIVPAIKKAHAFGIKDCFSEINTNPSWVDEEGRLRISPYTDFHSCPHGCKLCPPNMCKGMIVKRMQASLAKEGKTRMIYLGDGSGDFCPSLKLKEEDFVMPRKNFPVWDLILENRHLLKAEIHEWVDGGDLERILLKLVEKIKFLETNNPNSIPLLSSDCKLETVSLSSHEALPLALRVHQ